jgi:glycosyltransferase involved in cell wall biosynthesis
MELALMTEKVSAVICTYNEESNIADCINSVIDADEIIVADDGSTDRTVEIAESLGAKVFRRSDWSVTVTQDDFDRFRDRFKRDPLFTVGQVIRNGHLEAREAHSFASNDWIVVPDADERVTWDLKRIKEELFPIADQITHEFVHSHDENGNPHRVSTITKLFRRSMTKVDGRVHGAIIPNGRIVTTDLMRIDHWQKPGHSQSYVMPILEYCVITDNSTRSRFYLGREYYYYHKYDEALSIFEEYLADSAWWPEIAQCRLYQTRCYWESGRGDQAREMCLEAIRLNPDFTEALHLMSELYYEPNKSKWKFIAENSTGKDVLF